MTFGSTSNRAISQTTPPSIAALRASPQGLSRTDISNEVFHRNLSKTKIDEALIYLQRLDLAFPTVEQTAGPPVHRWFLAERKTADEEFE
jgi:hypothetical protein